MKLLLGVIKKIVSQSERIFSVVKQENNTVDLINFSILLKWTVDSWLDIIYDRSQFYDEINFANKSRWSLLN